MVDLDSGRAPRGARGLKQAVEPAVGFRAVSRPARGAWIETGRALVFRLRYLSRPARGAWIETKAFKSPPVASAVAPRAGRVD